MAPVTATRGVLSYQSIKKLCVEYSMVWPWAEKTVFRGKTYGLSESGYDVRIKQDVTLYPITFGNLLWNWLFGRWAPRRSFLLASTFERFIIPENIMFQVADKSSWARLGLTVQNTIGEPGWAGFLTLELTNHSDKVIHIPSGSPIAQLIFVWLDEATQKPYRGKYSGQADMPVEAIHEGY